jgi:hypothetical protein
VKRAILALACCIALFSLGAPASAGPLQEGSFTLRVHFLISAGHSYFAPS